MQNFQLLNNNSSSPILNFKFNYKFCKLCGNAEKKQLQTLFAESLLMQNVKSLTFLKIFQNSTAKYEK